MAAERFNNARGAAELNKISNPLGYSTLALAIFIKFMYFNVYDYSEMEEQVSKYSYQPINGVRLILVYFLAVCCGLLSVDGKLTLCKLGGFNIKSSWQLTYAARGGNSYCSIFFSTLHKYEKGQESMDIFQLLQFFSLTFSSNFSRCSATLCCSYSRR